MRSLATAHIAADVPAFSAVRDAARLRFAKVSAKTTRKTTTAKAV